ncbi:MAG: endonuclease/exonuclease/phosphatase family protein [Chloroflexota bacterium]
MSITTYPLPITALFHCTVVTLNLRNQADRWLERRDLVVQQLLETQPDLISLQEISFPIGQGRWLAHQLNLRLSGSMRRPYRLAQQRKRHLTKGYFEGIGILSKLPIVSHDALSLGYGGRVALRVNVELPSRQTVDFVAVHLHHVTEDRQARHEQVMKLLGWLNAGGRAPLQIIAGDFNETPGGPAVQQMKQAYRSALAEANGRDPLATFPTALVARPDGWAGCLDYIFVSGPVHVLSARLCCHRPAAHDDTLYPSDHVGLLAALGME